MSKTFRSAIVAVAALAGPSSAFWRMPCPGRLVLERIDPVISPGVVSGHVHTVSGGIGLGFTTSYEQQRASVCSSCPVKQDLSAYWTPKLYYMGEDGSYFEDVPQAGEGNGVTGGMTIYYEQRPGPKNDEVKAFPAGLRMVAGDPFQRNYTDQQAAPGNAVSFVCLNYNGVSTQYNDMPNINCPDGLRAQVYFPSCWDGVNLDSPDHKSHMAYPIGNYDNGYCPPSHPTHLISIFYEVIYQTGNFAHMWWNSSQHPFVFAMGDRTGYGFHGDFVNGWDTQALQDAIDQCTNDSGNLSDCPVFADLYSNEECQACRLPPQVNETITGNLTKLPGCNPVTDGPEYAPPPECSSTPIGPMQTYFTDETKSLGWEYVGCANDSVSARTFQAASSSSNTMTVETCIKFCSGKGYSLAGLEYASQCYCDNGYLQAKDGTREPLTDILGQCTMPCAGNAQQMCGGPSALSVYRNCAGGSCENALFRVNGSTTTNKRRHVHGSRHARYH
ncbi:hypothetical protein BAUCODRAFT_377209 [Baudoinia panamericana UAMH 10762]|uniref:WSC domain-containing protein n=1 Tax=Baudoinia panamericana (strain UAMH 10762) TaxID=717646 RepID=M2MPI9_BAUPA|nr:uncharacterized protein BAUCODRAFT_377209 [Baudoinia panamericana UAMH 10762]EMC98661.1 hypothetical protein BAUCODRAFT_377209 [Baudoinia panamericana UAMH 10762]